MSMDTYVVGFRPADEKWNGMKRIWEMCEKQKVPIPKEVEEFFNDDPPGDKPGMEIEIEDACTEYEANGQAGIEVDTSKLPKGVKILRFINSL